jgi:uncharacterized protein
VRRRIPLFIAVVQAILLLGHLFLYETSIFFWAPESFQSIVALRIAMLLLSVSFVGASLLAFRNYSFPVRILYTFSALWLGLVNFLMMAACGCWIVFLGSRMLGAGLNLRALASSFLAAALLATLYGFVNASLVRTKRIHVALPNLPESWRGRTAAMVSDLHLGHVRNSRFARRVVATLGRLAPDVVFIPGDLYDGTAADVGQLAKPWTQLAAPLGIYFVTGNHEEFSERTSYIAAMKRSGVTVLSNEKMLVDGLQLVGVLYHESVSADRYRSVLNSVNVDRGVASILLVHEPRHLPIAEEAGISLQLSGHTHRGQFFPFTKIVKRIWGAYAYGLQRYRNLSIYISCGAGTWGPPLRVGTTPEIVLIHFD